jgi:glycosyltransferase involved in cell wall biosynthesis
MRVLIIRNAYSYDFGGGERFPVDLAAELSKHGFAPVVASSQAQLLRYAGLQHVMHLKSPWWQHQNFSGKNVLLVPLYALWQLFLICWYLGAIIGLRPQVVHPESRDDFIAATFAAKLLGKRVIWTDHADLKYIFANHQVWYKNPVGKLVYLASKLADIITLVSGSEKDLIEQALGQPVPPKYRVIHNGVLDIVPTPISRRPEDREAIIFCATSRLVTAKGISELIDAFKRLNAKNPHTRLWLVGDGPETDNFKQLAADNPSISFFGHSDKPLDYVSAADIFVHPSYHEGFSLSLVEAAMLAKPIVACSVGGNPEIIQDHVNGLLVPQKDSDALYHALSMLADNKPLRQRFGNTARQTFTESFNFERIVRESFVPLYKDMRSHENR